MTLLGHGGVPLVDRTTSTHTTERQISHLKKIEITGRVARECISIAYGFFSPLDGFMTKETVDTVCTKMELPDGTLWPIPIVLDVEADQLTAGGITEGDTVYLTHQERPLAVLEVSDVFQYDTSDMAAAVLGTREERHPGVRMLQAMGDTFLGGTITLVTEPQFQSPFDRFWCPPRQLRQAITEKGWQRVVAHQTRNVPHKGHEWLMKGAWFAANGDLPVEELHTGVLVNCIIGPKKVGDYIDEAILLGHQELQDAGYFRTEVHLVSFALWDMRYAGPREALLHAIIRTNLGCTHHMFGRDHAGVSGFYDPYDAHRIFERIPDGALGIKPIRVLEWWYCPVCGEMTYSGLCAHTDQKESISGTRLRQMIQDRTEPSATLMRPEVFTRTLACADRYGFGSPFCTDRYLADRDPVFTLEEG